MAFYRRRPRPDAEKCADPAKARASALETLAGQEVSANILYERLCPELEAAAALVDSRYRKKLAIGRRDLVVAALQRRGFAYPVIKEAIRRVEEGE